MLYLLATPYSDGRVPIRVAVKRLPSGNLSLRAISVPWRTALPLREGEGWEYRRNDEWLLPNNNSIPLDNVIVYPDTRLRVVKNCAILVDGRGGWKSEGGETSMYPDRFSFRWDGGRHPAATIDNRGRAYFYSRWRNRRVEIKYKGEDADALIKHLESLVDREREGGFLVERDDIEEINLVRIASGPLETGPPSNMVLIKSADRLTYRDGCFYVKNRPEKGEWWEPTPIQGICNPTDDVRLYVKQTSKGKEG